MTDVTNSESPVVGDNVEVVEPTTKSQAEIDADQDATIEANKVKAEQDLAKATEELHARITEAANTAADEAVSLVNEASTKQAEVDNAQNNAIKASEDKALKDLTKAIVDQAKTDAAQSEKIALTQRIVNSSVEAAESKNNSQDEKIAANTAAISEKASKEELTKATNDLGTRVDAMAESVATASANQTEVDAAQDSAIAQNKGAASMAAKLGFEARETNAAQDKAIAENKAEIERTRNDSEENFQVSMAMDEEIRSESHAKYTELDERISATEQAGNSKDSAQDATLEEHSKNIKDTIRKQNDLRTSIGATKEDVKDLRNDLIDSRDTLCTQGNKIANLENRTKKTYEDVEGMKKEFGKVDAAWKTSKNNSTRLSDHEYRVSENEREIKSNQFHLKQTKEAIEANFEADVERANRQAVEDNKQNAALGRIDFDNSIQEGQIERLSRSESKNFITDADQDYSINKLSKRVDELEKTCKKSAIFGRSLLTITVAIIGAVIIILSL